MEFNPQKQLAGLLEWMDQQMTLCHGKTAVIGISGGKDSSTVAALAVAAYGRENVYGVLMPNGVQPDIDYSQALVEHLNIPHCTINIHDAVQGVLHEMEQAGLEPSRQTRVNLPSRIRMATLYAVAQTVPDGIVINTSNLSEDWVGYCTIYGDSAGAFSPLGMYTTEEVIALGRVLGLPEKFLVKAPSDGLTGVSQRFAHGPHRRNGLLQIRKNPAALPQDFFAYSLGPKGSMGRKGSSPPLSGPDWKPMPFTRLISWK